MNIKNLFRYPEAMGIVLFVVALTGIGLFVPIIFFAMVMNAYQRREWNTVKERRLIVLNMVYSFFAFMVALIIGGMSLGIFTDLWLMLQEALMTYQGEGATRIEVIIAPIFLLLKVSLFIMPFIVIWFLVNKLNSSDFGLYVKDAFGKETLKKDVLI